MRNESKDEGRAARIKDAAKLLFLDKGYDGSTMQAIADASGVNKALLHYYFESKDKLFLLVFREELAELSASLAALWEESERTLRDRLLDWVDSQTAFIARAPRLPLFVISEMSRNPQLIHGLLGEFLPPPSLLKAGGAAEADGLGADSQGLGLPPLVELIGTLYSLIFFPALAAPMIQHLLGVDSPLFQELMASQARLAKELVRQRLGGADPR
jgi:AcrR family transcriptional regulator